MMSGGVFTVDGEAFKTLGFVATGKGAHGVVLQSRFQVVVRIEP